MEADSDELKLDGSCPDRALTACRGCVRPGAPELAGGRIVGCLLIDGQKRIFSRLVNATLPQIEDSF